MTLTIGHFNEQGEPDCTYIEGVLGCEAEGDSLFYWFEATRIRTRLPLENIAWLELVGP